MKFLHQMSDWCFGTALEKLRYLRQVFKQHGSDEAKSTNWLLSFGTRMLTPTSERHVQRLQLRFGDVPETNLLALLRVFKNPSTVTAVLTGARATTREEDFRVKHAEEQARVALATYASGFRDEVRGDEKARFEFWKASTEKIDMRKAMKRRASRMEGESFRSSMGLTSPRAGGAGEAEAAPELWDTPRGGGEEAEVTSTPVEMITPGQVESGTYVESVMAGRAEGESG